MQDFLAAMKPISVLWLLSVCCFFDTFTVSILIFFKLSLYKSQKEGTREYPMTSSFRTSIVRFYSETLLYTLIDVKRLDSMISLMIWWKPFNKGFQVVKWKSFIRKFYQRYHKLVGHYWIFVSQMTTDIFQLSLQQLRSLCVPHMKHELLTLLEFPR